MNTHLKNVKLILKGQPAQPLDGMSVRGNQIRCARSTPLPCMPARPIGAASSRTPRRKLGCCFYHKKGTSRAPASQQQNTLAVVLTYEEDNSPTGCTSCRTR